MDFRVFVEGNSLDVSASILFMLALQSIRFIIHRVLLLTDMGVSEMIKLGDKFVSTNPPVDFLSFLPSATVTLLVLYSGIRFPIPWLWENLWKIFAIPLIFVWVPVIGFLSYLIGGIVFKFTKIAILLVVDAILYISILITHFPILYSFIRPDWGASLLLIRTKSKRYKILDKISAGNAWRLLQNVERKSEREFLDTLHCFPQHRVEAFLYMESFTRRQRILNKLGLVANMSKDTKPYITHQT